MICTPFVVPVISHMMYAAGGSTIRGNTPEQCRSRKGGILKVRPTLLVKVLGSLTLLSTRVTGPLKQENTIRRRDSLLGLHEVCPVSGDIISLILGLQNLS